MTTTGLQKSAFGRTLTLSVNDPRSPFFVSRCLKEWGQNMDTTLYTGISPPKIWENLTCQYESFVLCVMGEVRLDCVAIDCVIVSQDVDAVAGVSLPTATIYKVQDVQG